MEKFRLKDKFVEKYKKIKPPFGFNGLGEIQYYRAYSRLKEDGSNEQWYETIRRVVEGTYSVQKRHIIKNGLGWSENKAHKSAEEMYDRMFNMKFLPPGRGLWAMGSKPIEEKGLFGALNNCAFVSTNNIDKDLSKPFLFMMDKSMLGVGTGFDVDGGNKLKIKSPIINGFTYIIPDTREGWVESVRYLLDAYFKGESLPEFDYSKIREKGAPIKGFGGKSSGPEPLKKLHKDINELLNERIGDYLTEENIADIMNKIGVCVVSGNVRRTAQIMLGDEDDEEFMSLKDYTWDGEKYIGSKAHRAPFGWTSNNSVRCKIGQDYSVLAKQTGLNGEPGYLWMENARNYGRMSEAPDYKDKKAVGVNPCLSYDTPLLTNLGFKKIGELEGKESYFIDSKGNTVKGKVWKTGLKDVIQLKYAHNNFFREIKCTSDHKFLDIDGNETKAENLKGKRIMPMFHEKQLTNMNIPWVSLGFIQGDGRTNPANRQITVNDDDIKEIFIAPTYKELKKLGFSKEKLPKRKPHVLINLPSTFKEWKLKDRLDFITGLYTANGSVLEKAKRVTLKTSNKILAEEVRSFLLEIGIGNYITTNKQHDVKFYNGVYTCKESYDVNIGGLYSLRIFSEKINFIQSYKREKLKKIILNSSPKIQSIKRIGKEKVYDFSLMSDNHWGVTQDHLIVHNCGEQTLESYEMCCLVETFPIKHTSLHDFKRTLKFAYLYAKTVTLGHTHWVETNRVQLRNRRIGTSVSGVAQFIGEKGISVLKHWLKIGYETIQYYDEVYSDWLAVPKSIKTTSVKPSGSISLVAGVTPGVHYPISNYYIRRSRISANHELIPYLSKAGYYIEPDVTNPDNTFVVEVPVKIENCRTLEDVSIWEQCELAAFMQEHWADNQVSCTVSFRPEEREQIKNVLQYYQYRLKSISFLPKTESVYAQMPYEAISKEKYESLIKNIKGLTIKSLSEKAEPDKFCDGDSCLV